VEKAFVDGARVCGVKLSGAQRAGVWRVISQCSVTDAVSIELKEILSLSFFPKSVPSFPPFLKFSVSDLPINLTSWRSGPRGTYTMAPKEEAVTTQTLWSPSSSRSSSWSWFTGKVHRTMGCTTTTHHAAFPGQTT
jgi:hypothetical protein